MYVCPFIHLSLPDSFQDLYKVFTSLDRIFALLHNRQENISYKKLKTSIQQMTRKDFKLGYIKQIKTLFPEAYKVEWNHKLSDYELSVQLKEKMTPEIIKSRSKIFYESLVLKCKNGADSIQESELPSQPKTENMTVSQVLKKFPISSENSKPAAPAVLRKSVSESLKNVSKSVIDKVLMREGMAASRSCTTGEQTGIDKNRLQKLARFLKNLFVAEGKQALMLKYVLSKSMASIAVPIDVTLKDINELEVISKKWVMQVKSKGDDYLKLNMDTNFEEIIAVIRC